jgi:hypothetical protein
MFVEFACWFVCIERTLIAFSSANNTVLPGSVNGKDVFYTPNLKGIQPGFYKSGDPAAISAHVKALDYAWADLGIISWFGPRHRLDKARITQLMDETVAQGSSIKWTVYHEDERNRDASVDELVADLNYLEEWFAWHPSFAHIDGKPISTYKSL